MADAPGHRANAAWALAITIVMAALANSALAGARLLLPIMAFGMGATALFVGLMSALFAASPMLLSVSFGRWVDRKGTLRPMLLGVALIACAGLPFLIWPMPPMLMPLAALVGSGAILVHVATLRAVTNASVAASRARNLGYLSFGYSLFQFIGPVAATYAFEHAGLRGGVLSLCALALPALLASSTSRHCFENARPVAVAGTSRPQIASLVRLAPLRRWIVISSMFSTAQVIFPFVLSLYAIEKGISAPRAGLALGVFALGTAGSRICVGWVAHRFSPQTIITVSLLGSALTYALLVIGGHHGSLMPLCGVLGLCLGMGVPISLGPIYDEAPSGRANEAIGLSMTLNTLLQTVLPLAFAGLRTEAMISCISVSLLATAILSASSFRSSMSKS